MRRTLSSWGTDGAAVSSNLPHVELVITRGRATHRVREVHGAAFLIGSAPDCDLVLGDPQFGLVHSYLLVNNDRVAIRHLGFGPKLNVSGQEVAWAALGDEDLLQTGPYEFRVRIRWPEGIPTPRYSAEVAGPRYVRDQDERQAVERLLRDIHRASIGVPYLGLHVESGEDATGKPHGSDSHASQVSHTQFRREGRAL